MESHKGLLLHYPPPPTKKRTRQSTNAGPTSLGRGTSCDSQTTADTKVWDKRMSSLGVGNRRRLADSCQQSIN